jgi:hypothetical protein
MREVRFFHNSPGPALLRACCAICPGEPQRHNKEKQYEQPELFEKLDSRRIDFHG